VSLYTTDRILPRKSGPIYESGNIVTKIEKTYDGLDRLVGEKVYKKSNSWNTQTQIYEKREIPPEYTQTSHKEYIYHPVFTGKIAYTKVLKEYADNPGNTPCSVIYTEYGSLGRPVQVKTGTVTYATTDHSGLTVVKTIQYDDTNNHITEYNYRESSVYAKKKIEKDWNNNTTRVLEWTAVSSGDTIPADMITTSVYDMAGHCTEMTSPAGEVFSYDYDTMGQLESTGYMDGTTETYVYDMNGNLMEKKDRKGNIIAYTYDSLNMLRTEKTYNPAGTLTSRTETDYSHFGSPTSITGTTITSAGEEEQLYHYSSTYNTLGLLTEFTL
jgi:YD repeat-containing protein